ncbi:MAG: DUF3089 domain-containing protein, partial [Sphingomonas sp.]|nr:DUF3089 domain-containing protein [Sphingomonas sp.]
MCARRFLILVFFLTLIVVGGALALYQWGDRVLVRMATPEGHYQEPPRHSGPDYGKLSAWLARPGLADDPSRWAPEGVDVPSQGEAATFYVHPTTYLERDRWNAPLDPGGEPARRARIFVETQGGAFANVSEVWAPRYRQAAYGAFLLDSPDAQKALALAYRDVLAAFDSFIAAQPAGRPIILAGHSQGSLHLLKLLADRRAALSGRLVAAYVVGWPVGVSSDLPATGLPPCTAPGQAGCVLSWQSFMDPANTALVTRAWAGSSGLTGAKRSQDEMLCTNPLAGTRDASAPPSSNRGTLVPDASLKTARLE